MTACVVWRRALLPLVCVAVWLGVDDDGVGVRGSRNSLSMVNRRGGVLGGVEFGSREEDMEPWTPRTQQIIDEAQASRGNVPDEQVLRMFNAAVDDSPASFQPYMARGSFLASIDNTAAAEADFSRGLSLLPAHVAPRLVPHAALDLGQAFYRNRQLASAHEALDLIFDSLHADEETKMLAW